MNRDLWFRILQVIVVAPYIYKLSAETDNDYFNIGLKLVAGSIIMMNLKPLLVQAAPLLKAVADMTATATEGGMLTEEQKAGAVDVEFVKQT